MKAGERIHGPHSTLRNVDGSLCGLVRGIESRRATASQAGKPRENLKGVLAFSAIVKIAILSFDAIIANRPPFSGLRAFFARGSPAVGTN
jgi:hypothetical protein